MIEFELSVGEVAKRSGVSVATIHFYESKGLISSYRTSGNQRRFAREVLRRVALIKVAQNLGFNLGSIRKTLDTLPKKNANSSDWNDLSKSWKIELQKRIDDLEILRDQLNSCIGCGCLSMKDCPLRNPWDKLAKKGPGPHLLT